MEINPIDQKMKTLDTTRTAYEPPKLRMFGQVGKLTQGGSGGMSETFYTMGPMTGECMTQNVMRDLC